MRALSSVDNELSAPAVGDPRATTTDISGPQDTIATTLGLIQLTPRGSKPKGLARFQKYKPWDKRLKSNALNTKIRVKLATIDSYDREVVSVPQATPKVMVRLERVTGTDRVRIKNFKYLEMLSKRIEEEEDKAVERLHQKRAGEELQRYRDLVIDGKMDPVEGMEDYSENPLFKVNRIMKRLNKAKFTYNDSLNPTRKAPLIIPTEPFSDYENTGILFGHHPEHYLKTKPIVGPASPGNGSTASLSQQVTARNSEEEWGGEDNEDEPISPPLILPESTTAFGELLRRNSMSLARRYLGLDPNDQRFTPQRHRVIEEFLNEDYTMDPMYDFGTNISDTMKRSQAKTDDFCTKTHRKLFS